MFGAKCILLLSLISFSSSKFLITTYSPNLPVDVRKFVNESSHIWTVHSRGLSSTVEKDNFACKVDIIEEKAADHFTFKRTLQTKDGTQHDYWAGEYVGSDGNYPLILLNHTEGDLGGLIEYVAFMDPGRQCGIYFTGIIIQGFLQENHKKKNTWPTVFAPQNMTSLYGNRMGYVMCEERRKGNSERPVETSACLNEMRELCGDMKYITKFSKTSCGEA